MHRRGVALTLKRRAAGLAGATLILLGSAWAQETTSGSIAGRVTDPQDAPVPGAVVTISSDQGSRDLVTDTRGRFFAPYLTPAVYSVRVELTGFSPAERRDVTVHLGQRVELPFALEVGSFEEVLQVDAESPVVDMSSTTAGGVLDSAQLQALPVGRKFTETLYMVPGVSDGSGVGAANPSISGSSGLNNHYVVDGVNITNVGYGGIGVYTQMFGSLGSGVTTDFIKETQVKSAGFEAEYGQATGGVVNVVTRSGSNVYRREPASAHRRRLQRLRQPRAHVLRRRCRVAVRGAQSRLRPRQVRRLALPVLPHPPPGPPRCPLRVVVALSSRGGSRRLADHRCQALSSRGAPSFAHATRDLLPTSWSPLRSVRSAPPEPTRS